jgi:hypothetical protein
MSVYEPDGSSLIEPEDALAVEILGRRFIETFEVFGTTTKVQTAPTIARTDRKQIFYVL